MKDEEQAARARLTWGDLAFGLEIARWRIRRLLNASEMLRRICGIKREESPVARQGLLLIEVTGLTGKDLEAAMKAGKVPFLQSLLSAEQYELLPLNSENRLAQLEETARTHLQTIPGVARGAADPAGGNGSRKVRAGIQLAAGWPLVQLTLPRGQTSEGNSGNQSVPAGRRLRRLDRTIRRLYRKALLSATADYEVWIVAEGADGFALLPPPAPALARVLAPAVPAEAWKRIRCPEKAFRVLTYNIHSTVGLDGKVAPSRIARIIRGFDPDIVALQEVDLKRARSKGEDQAARLARELDMHVAFCCTAERAWERYGHALLTRFPVTVIRSSLFPGEELSAEPRGALLAKIAMAGRTVYVANTHFGLKEDERWRQAEMFLGPEWLGRVPANAPVIACGDFNMRPASRAYALISKCFKDAHSAAKIRHGGATFPSPIPMTRLDFVFLSHHFTVERVAVVRSAQTGVASDHLPLVADCRFD